MMFLFMTETQLPKCELCGKEIEWKTGGSLDDMLVCDDCFEKAQKNSL